jgi:hypothetical protein
MIDDAIDMPIFALELMQGPLDVEAKEINALIVLCRDWGRGGS